MTLFDLNSDGQTEIIFHGGRGAFDTATVRGALVVDGQTRAQQSIAAPHAFDSRCQSTLAAVVVSNATSPREVVT